ncbi:MAG: DUF6020 family protein, partial [Lachnospiraceae bacterium]|nr:DUF6020 family protein [Lachnospiraceae bacterium]
MKPEKLSFFGSTLTKCILSMIMAMGLPLSFPAGKKQLKLHGIKGLADLLKVSYPRNQAVLLAVFVLALIVLFFYDRCKEKTLRMKIMNGIVAVLFALSQILGECYSEYASWYPITRGSLFRCRFLVAFLGISCFVYHVLFLLQELLDRAYAKILVGTAKRPFFPDKTSIESLAEQSGQTSAKSIPESSINSSSKSPSKASGRSTIKTMGFLLLCWLPYLIIFYPGTCNHDTSDQILQFFHRDIWVRYYTATPADDIYMTNHFPVLTTFIYGGFARFGLLLGDIRIGFALHSVLQMILMAAVITKVLRFLQRKGLTGKGYKAAVLFFALLPVFPLYAICMLKDVPYILCLMVLMLDLWEFAETKGEELLSTRHAV